MYILFWVTYDICRILNIFLEIRFAIAGEILYPIYYFILIGVEKLQTLSNHCCCDEDCGLGVAEFFELRTVYAVFFNPYQVRPPYDIYKLIQERTILLLFIQSNIFFRFNIFESPIISEFDAVLAYVLFLSNIIFVIAVNDLVFEQSRKKEILFLVAGYTLFSSLFLLPSENVGFSIGYFHYIFVGAEVPAFIIYSFDKPFMDFMVFTHNMIDYLQVTQRQVQQDDLIEHLQFSIPSSYIKILVMLIFLLSLGINYLSNKLYSNIATLNVSEAIALINITLAIIFGIIYLVYYFKRFVSIFYQYKFIQLYDENDLLTTVKYLKETRKLPKNIQFLFPSRAASKDRSSQYLLQNCSDNLCKLCYELILDINQKKIFSNVQITSHTNELVCQEHVILFLETAEEIMKELKGYFLSTELKPQVKLQIISKRIHNGLIFKKLTKTLVEELENDNKEQEKTWIFLQQKAMALQITGFMVVLSPQVTFSPQQILYDLYEI